MKRFFVILVAVMLMCGASAAMEVIEVQSEYVPSPAKVSVALPAGYDTCGIKDVRYPVVYMLNGHGGDHTTWGKIADLDSLATEYGVIIVCPAGLDSWYWNSPVVPAMRMEDYIIKELVPWIDGRYRTRASREGRAVTGLSMGGHGGLWLGLRHPDLFANAGSTSGGVDIRPFPKHWNIPSLLGSYDKSRDLWDSHTVINLVPGIRPGYVNIIFDCGTEDFFYEVNNNMHRELDRYGIPHTYLTSPGAHNPAYWRRSIVTQLQFFRSHFYCD